jgi:hypothetical protein
MKQVREHLLNYLIDACLRNRARTLIPGGKWLWKTDYLGCDYGEHYPTGTNPYLPLTPQQIIDDAVRAVTQGQLRSISMQGPQDCQPTTEPAVQRNRRGY